MLAANQLCAFEGELPPLDTFDDRAKLNVTVTVLDVDDDSIVGGRLWQLKQGLALTSMRRDVALRNPALLAARGRTDGPNVRRDATSGRDPIPQTS